MKTVVETLDQVAGKKWIRNECDEKGHHVLCNPLSRGLPRDLHAG